MKKYFSLIFLLIIPMFSFAQPEIYPRCPYKAIQVTDSRMVKEAKDFTITTTDGVTRNLYNTLDSGKTVFIDLFYTTCSYCQLYAPIIEEIYQNTGAGEGDIEFWGITNNLFDTNWVIDEYREEYNVSNPCAGPWGGGTTAFSIIVFGQNFNGFPTYCVICPDRTLIFDACYPPTLTCFDPYFEQCASIGIDEAKPGNHEPGILSIYPNPARDEVFIDFILTTKNHFGIEIVDLPGRVILSQIINTNFTDQPVAIPVGHLKSGTYIVKLIGDDQVIDSHKLLISGR